MGVPEAQDHIPNARNLTRSLLATRPLPKVGFLALGSRSVIADVATSPVTNAGQTTSVLRERPSANDDETGKSAGCVGQMQNVVQLDLHWAATPNQAAIANAG